MPDSPNLRRRLGITRRDLLRRGAIVGGTLIWTVPVIESLTRNSLAHVTSPRFFCCFCKQGKRRQCISGPTSNQACRNACRQAGFGGFEFHGGPNPIPCSNQNGCGAH